MLQIESLKKIKEYFINKPITIFTDNIGRNYSDLQYSDYFTGICTYISNDIVETIHPVTKCKNIFFIKNIIGICEEQQLDPSNPEHQKIITEMNKKEQNVEQDLPLSDTNTINIDLLSKLAQK